MCTVGILEHFMDRVDLRQLGGTAHEQRRAHLGEQGVKTGHFEKEMQPKRARGLEKGKSVRYIAKGWSRESGRSYMVSSFITAKSATMNESTQGKERQ